MIRVVRKRPSENRGKAIVVPLKNARYEELRIAGLIWQSSTLAHVYRTCEQRAVLSRPLLRIHLVRRTTTQPNESALGLNDRRHALDHHLR